MNNKASFVNFPIGNACNLRCKFCYNDSWREERQYFEDLDKLVYRLEQYEFKGQKAVNIIGGEPLMYPQFFELLDYLQKNDFYITMVTNGINFSNEMFMKKFLKYKDIVKNINFSIHSHNNELEDAITGRKGIFDKKYKSLNVLIENNILFTLSLVVNQINIPYLFDIVSYYNLNFSKKISLQCMITYEDFSKENIENIPKYSEVIKSIDNIVNKNEEIKMVHWLPLCIHNKVRKINYKIRELDRRFLYSAKWSGGNLIKSHMDKNFIGDECKKCYAFGKFCYGPGKIYVNKFGYDEFKKMDKDDVKNVIRATLNK